MNIQPLGDRVVVQRDSIEKEQRLDSGIYISQKEDEGTHKKQGTVVAVGPGKKNSNGESEPLSVSKGDVVLFSWGDSVTIDGQEYDIVKEENILAIIS
jgi:chaperonin GroES